MLQVGDTLVSLDVIERCFVCDLKSCCGACCIEGDSGAPLTNEEIIYLRDILPIIWNDLREDAQAVIRIKGVAYIDVEGETVTSIVNGKDCVFTAYDSDGICYCSIERAFREGRIPKNKPISCRLYPIRIKDYGEYRAVNYDRWKICQSAEKLGRREGIRIYQFLKEPLISRFGQDWYNELELCATEWNKLS
jgi:Fe-S-cluster containining protein